MTELRVLVVCPLVGEAAAIRRRFGLVADGELFRGPDPALALLHGGVGERCADRTRAQLERLRPTVVLLAGVAGGVDPTLGPGALVLVDRTVDEAGEVELPRGPIERAQAAFPSATTGACREVRALVGRAADKRRIEGARIVDMESASVARAARDLGIPLAVARVVLDTALEDIPDFGPLVGPTGRPRPLAVAAHLARRPHHVWAMGRHGVRLGRASALLARWVALF